MKATIRDAEILRAIRPLELVGYLRANGWHEEQPLERGAFWLKESKEQSYELLLPLDSNLGDFANRIAEVLQVLERAEQRSQLEIVEDLMMVSADVIRPRLPGTGSEGSLSLSSKGQSFTSRREISCSLLLVPRSSGGRCMRNGSRSKRCSICGMRVSDRLKKEATLLRSFLPSLPSFRPLKIFSKKSQLLSPSNDVRFACSQKHWRPLARLFGKPQ